MIYVIYTISVIHINHYNSKLVIYIYNHIKDRFYRLDSTTTTIQI